ncbi:MAG: hypothetical protein O2923_05260 [Verrucomicrobia bacterium]|nr:hypothetical protein [Verrucomicrobiota bacterium]MDA1087560.1 hypothetical protein [Verrucomicrobiota bacterium]
MSPDLVIWQWCINDLCNNSFEMDRKTVENFNIQPRPYLENEVIRMRVSRGVPFLSHHSALYRYLAPRLVRGMIGRQPSAVDIFRITEPHYQRAVAVTDAILARSKATFGSTPVLAFLAGGLHYEYVFEDLARRNDIAFTPHVDAELDRFFRAGISVSGHPSIGSHWSPEGHQAAAGIIFEALRQHYGDMLGGGDKMRPAVDVETSVIAVGERAPPMRGASPSR